MKLQEIKCIHLNTKVVLWFIEDQHMNELKTENKNDQLQVISAEMFP